MFKDTKAFSGFSVDDMPRAKQFYGETLGLNVSEEDGMLQLQLGAGGTVLVYPKADHTPASFTILNFPVENVEQTVEQLRQAGVEFERYDGELGTEKGGIHRGRGQGPDIAWFRDPAGNILSVLELEE